MGEWRKGKLVGGRFGRSRKAGRDRTSEGSGSATDWLDPESYNALSFEERMALADRRRRERYPHGPRGSALDLRRQAAIIAVAAGAILALGWLTEFGLSPVNLGSRSAQVTTRFGYCHAGGGFNCVVDGDTFWLDGVDIRIADIDAPETHDYRCSEELSLGNRATDRLHQLLESGPLTLQPIDRDEDVYGRKLRLVFVNGTNVGETLIDEGLAHRYVRGKLPWC